MLQHRSMPEQNLDQSQSCLCLNVDNLCCWEEGTTCYAGYLLEHPSTCIYTMLVFARYFWLHCLWVLCVILLCKLTQACASVAHWKAF